MKYYFICKGCGLEHIYPPITSNCVYCGYTFEPTLPVFEKQAEYIATQSDKSVTYISQIVIGVCLGILFARILEYMLVGVVYLIITALK